MESIFKMGVIVSAVDKLTAPFKKMSKTVSNFEERAEALRKKATQFSVIGFTLANFAGTAEAALGRVVDPARELQAGISEVSTLLPQLQAPQLEALGDDFRIFLRDSPFEAADAVKGLYDTISAGINKPADALKFLGVAQRAAVAGVSDLGTAVDVGTTILGAWGDKAGDAEHVFDVLQTTVRLGKTKLTELGASFGQVASIAAVGKFRFEDVAASIATMTVQGIKTDQAMTSLRGLLVAIAAPTSEAGKELAKFGGDALIAAARAGNLPKVIEILARKKLTLPDIRKIIPDVEAAKAVAALMGGDLKTNLEAMAGSAGAVDKAYAKMNETFDVQSRLLKGNLFLALDSIGSAALPTLGQAVKEIIPHIQAFADWVKQHPQMATMGLKVAILGTAAIALLAPLAALAGTFLLFKSLGLGALAKAIAAFATGSAGLGAALATVVLPIAAFVAFANTLRLVLTNWDALKEGFTTEPGGIWDWAKSLVSLSDTVKPAVRRMKFETADELASMQGLDFNAAGRKLTEGLAGGIDDGTPEALAALQGLTTDLDAYLPHSDAKRGALSRLTEAGRKLPQTFAAGMRDKMDAIGAAFDAAVGPLVPRQPAFAMSGAGAAGSPGPNAPRGGARGAMNFQMTVNIHGATGDPQSIAREVRRQFELMLSEIAGN